MGVRYTVLGPVEVTAPGARIARVEPRHRAVLAYLLLHARTVIGTERLIGAMWGDIAPETARAQIHASIAVVRRVLRQAGADDALETRTAGYVIHPGDGTLDLDDFTAWTNPDAPSERLRAALELWRGAALADVNGAYVAGARARLAERRLTVLERLAELELSAGRHHRVVDELTASVAVHPLRERLVGQLMLALYRGGRQADALAAARDFRTALADGQGLDPSPAFVALHQGILRGDAGLLAPVDAAGRIDVGASAAAPEAVTPGTAADARQPAAEATASPAPDPPRHRASFLPPAVPDFAGRDAEVERLAEVYADDTGTATVHAINGMAGIGKTTLAVHVAHRIADRYPDGQLFVDLHAHTAGQPPLEPAAALETLLRQLGIPAEQIPSGLTERAAVWRAELADRRVLVVLDNAADLAQVAPLLPGAGRGLVLITSRRRLLDLDAARALSVDVLPTEDAVRLFGTIVGARADAEPDAVLDVLTSCGFLPLAIRIAAARLHHRPRWTVSYLMDRLRDEHRRLAELTTSDRGVAAAFALSYAQLTDDQRRMFRLLALHPGADLDAYAAAALAGLPPDPAETLLEDLLDAHMLTQREPGRYTFHDLLREHARATAFAEEPAEARKTAVGRLIDHYLSTASAAVDVLFPEGRSRRPRVAAPDRDPVPLGGPDRADRWLAAERKNLVAVGVHAADGHWPEHTIRLAGTLHHYLDVHAHLADARTLHTRALQAARQIGDNAGAARAHTDLGRLLGRVGSGDDEAAEHHEAAVSLYRELGEPGGEARALNNLGRLEWRRGRRAEAHEHYSRALDLFRKAGVRVGEAAALTNLATVDEHEGRHGDALDRHREALSLHREIGYRRGEVTTLDNLGALHRRLGRHEEALGCLREALDLCRELGYTGYEFELHNSVGETARARGDAAAAVSSHETALTLAAAAGNRPEQARAAYGLAQAHRDLGDHARARRAAERALDSYTALGSTTADAVREFLSELP